ncbi:hypothetical protein ENBRE01_3339 [Enteropsectra breve]|nr:hypothetical protein ENBRE01_3339 [Enteropsectra breve]
MKGNGDCDAKSYIIKWNSRSIKETIDSSFNKNGVLTCRFAFTISLDILDITDKYPLFQIEIANFANFTLENEIEEIVRQSMVKYRGLDLINLKDFYSVSYRIESFVCIMNHSINRQNYKNTIKDRNKLFMVYGLFENTNKLLINKDTIYACTHGECCNRIYMYRFNSSFYCVKENELYIRQVVECQENALRCYSCTSGLVKIHNRLDMANGCILNSENKHLHACYSNANNGTNENYANSEFKRHALGILKRDFRGRQYLEVVSFIENAHSNRIFAYCNMPLPYDIIYFVLLFYMKNNYRIIVISSDSLVLKYIAGNTVCNIDICFTKKRLVKNKKILCLLDKRSVARDILKHADFVFEIKGNLHLNFDTLSINSNIIFNNRNIMSQNKNLVFNSGNIMSHNKNILSNNKNIISNNSNIIFYNTTLGSLLDERDIFFIQELFVDLRKIYKEIISPEKLHKVIEGIYSSMKDLNMDRKAIVEKIGKYFKQRKIILH